MDEQIARRPGSGLIGQVDVGGSAVLAGTFNLDLANGFTPSIGQDFSVLTYGSATGAFAAFSGLTTGMTADQSATELDLDMPAPVRSPGPIPTAAIGTSRRIGAQAWCRARSDVVAIDTAATATITIQSVDDVQVQSLTTGSNDTLSITGGSLTVTGGDSTLSGPLSMTGGSLTASGPGVNLTASGATSVSSASLLAEGGATLVFRS